MRPEMWAESQGDRGRASGHREKVGRGLRGKPFLMGQLPLLPPGCSYRLPRLPVTGEKVTEIFDGSGGTWALERVFPQVPH